MGEHTPEPWYVYEAYGRRDNIAGQDGHVATFEEEADAIRTIAAMELLRKIAFEPWGHPTATYREMLNDIETEVRAFLNEVGP